MSVRTLGYSHCDCIVSMFCVHYSTVSSVHANCNSTGCVSNSFCPRKLLVDKTFRIYIKLDVLLTFLMVLWLSVL